MPKARPAPDEEVWWSGLKWALAAQMQAYRFENSLCEQAAAEADAAMRERLNDDSERSRAWLESYDADYEPFDPQRPLRVPSWALFAQVNTEADLLIVSIRHVLRAQQRLPEHTRTAMGDQEAIELLRNVAEHWDEVGGRSARELAAQYPAVTTDTYSFTTKEIRLGGVHGVPLSRVRAWLYRVDEALRDCLRQRGAHVPENWMSSRVPGDDELAWPQARLHYHWSIPQLPEEHWPREELPEEVAELLVVRFARLRQRDEKD